MTKPGLTVHDLPAPPAGKTGWPWTVGSAHASQEVSGSMDWPRISIVTASFNQGWAIEETIRSVLLQGYPNLEYIVMDGGSTDETVEILKKYGSLLDYCYSGPDQGQTTAMMTGFTRATGSIFGWMNSDDYFLPDALFVLARLRHHHPDAVAWIGATHEVDKRGSFLREVKSLPSTQEDLFEWGNSTLRFHQPGCLFDAEMFRHIGGLDTSIWGAMDVDLWIRLRGLGEFACCDDAVAAARIYAGMKSSEGMGDSRIMVDMISAAIKAGRRDMADRYAKMSMNMWMRKLARDIGPEVAMRAVKEEDYLNHLSFSFIARYLSRRGIRAVRKLLRSS
jgi:glycosyltransferase involved in cell wall biosynthesis